MDKAIIHFVYGRQNAQRVHLIGDFTDWYENQIPMTRNEGGVWEVFTDLPKEGYLNTMLDEAAVKKF